MDSTVKIKLLQILKNKICYLEENNIELVASGRTAIDFAIKDIKENNQDIKNALLPDYLCDSMIVPFEKNNISYDFYSIKFNGENFVVDLNNVLSKKYDIILVCDYFFHNKDLYESIIKIKNKNSKIIHDVTHTFLSNNTTFSNDDYIVCSLRKWFLTTDGGIVIKNSKNNLFSIKNKNEHNKYIYYKTKSREYKNLYYKDNTDNIKRKYIEYSKLAEQCLNDDFALYGISSETGEKLLNTNFDTEIKKRQKYYNLIKEKIDLSAIAYCLNGISKDNCLFTLPIIINENRNKILTLFYNNLIRCSILWEPTEKNKNVDTNFINKSICLDMTEDTDKKIEKILKKL